MMQNFSAQCLNHGKLQIATKEQSPNQGTEAGLVAAVAPRLSHVQVQTFCIFVK